MTPDCPLSPDDQDSTELVCRWMGCGHSFETLEELVSHLTASHVTSQHGAFFCMWNGCSRTKGFNARYKMLIHIRTHTNERPYVCSECDKRFSRQENLRIHARTHTGEKPYVCTVPGCGKAYSNSSDRFKHTRTHFVDKPYECRQPGCGKRYTDPSSLRKHVKIYGHSKKAEEAIPSINHQQFHSNDVSETPQTSVRYEMSPSPSSSGSSLGPSPVPSSSTLLSQTLFPGASNSVAAAVSAASIGAAAGLSPWSTASAGSINAVTAAAAWTVALHQYQAGLLLSTGANLGSLSVNDHNIETSQPELEEKSSVLDLSVCSSPLDLSLHSSRKRHK